MKINLIIFILFMILTAHSQSNHTMYTIEYSFAQSATENFGGYFEPAFAHSIFTEVNIATKRKWQYTIGLGYLQSQIIFRDYTGQQGFRDEERHYYINYIVLPVGIKFELGSFYIHPEVGAAYNYRLKIKKFVVDSKGVKIDGPFSESNAGHFEVHLSSLLSAGYEFKINSISLFTGVKGYFNLEPFFLNNFGAGLVIGLKL